jgi:hypothetical protein
MHKVLTRKAAPQGETWVDLVVGKPNDMSGSHSGGVLLRWLSSWTFVLGCTVAPARKSEQKRTPNLGCRCETVSWFVIRNGIHSAMDSLRSSKLRKSKSS